MGNIKPTDFAGHVGRIGFSRRKFVKGFVAATAVSSFAGNELLQSVMGACQPTVSGDGILEVDVSQFPALQNVNGSVRLLFNSLFGGSHPSGTLYPVLVNRGAGNQFYTLSSRCTHLGCVVPAFNSSLAASVCPCHLSRYAIDGTVIAGPATLPLTSYNNSFDGTNLCIEIPGLGYSVSGLAVQNGNAPRLSLQFPTFQGSQYQALFRQVISNPGTVIPFATTLSGSATNTIFTGTGSPATLYVDSTTAMGFYTITIITNEG
jgi:nitrite reductase/ring-hydroxylating ferredoxin subunit